MPVVWYFPVDRYFYKAPSNNDVSVLVGMPGQECYKNSPTVIVSVLEMFQSSSFNGSCIFFLYINVVKYIMT